MILKLNLEQNARQSTIFNDVALVKNIYNNSTYDYRFKWVSHTKSFFSRYAIDFYAQSPEVLQNFIARVGITTITNLIHKPFDQVTNRIGRFFSVIRKFKFISARKRHTKQTIRSRVRHFIIIANVFTRHLQDDILNINRF